MESNIENDAVSVLEKCSYFAGSAPIKNLAPVGPHFPIPQSLISNELAIAQKFDSFFERSESLRDHILNLFQANIDTANHDVIFPTEWKSGNNSFAVGGKELNPFKIDLSIHPSLADIKSVHFSVYLEQLVVDTIFKLIYEVGKLHEKESSRISAMQLFESNEALKQGLQSIEIVISSLKIEPYLLKTGFFSRLLRLVPFEGSLRYERIDKIFRKSEAPNRFAEDKFKFFKSYLILQTFVPELLKSTKHGSVVVSVMQSANVLDTSFKVENGLRYISLIT